MGAIDLPEDPMALSFAKAQFLKQGRETAADPF